MKKSVSVHDGDYCFALDGPTFKLLRMYDRDQAEKVIHRAKVFARMAPEDKQHLIEILQKIGYRLHNRPVSRFTKKQKKNDNSVD